MLIRTGWAILRERKWRPEGHFIQWSTGGGVPGLNLLPGWWAQTGDAASVGQALPRLQALAGWPLRALVPLGFPAAGQPRPSVALRKASSECPAKHHLLLSLLPGHSPSLSTILTAWSLLSTCSPLIPVYPHPSLIWARFLSLNDSWASSPAQASLLNSGIWRPDLLLDTPARASGAAAPPSPSLSASAARSFHSWSTWKGPASPLASLRLSRPGPCLMHGNPLLKLGWHISAPIQILSTMYILKNLFIMEMWQVILSTVQLAETV